MINIIKGTDSTSSACDAEADKRAFHFKCRLYLAELNVSFILNILLTCHLLYLLSISLFGL